MGCGLNKLEKRDDKRPGNIYSTLKRPQVETKTDVSYEYRFLEFTTLSAAELPRSSAVRLASLRDLPAQLLELYQQGFSLVTLHPFVQPTQERKKTPLEHIFRAILIKKTDKSQKTDLHNEGYILELDCSSSLSLLAGQKIIPEFVKEIQEAASRGLKFVGVIPQYHCPVDSHPPMPSANSVQDSRKEPGRSGSTESLGAADRAPAGTDGNPGRAGPADPASLPSGERDGAGLSPRGVNQTLDGRDSELSEVLEDPVSAKMEIFTLFNKPKSHQKCRQYYPVTIPLRVSKNGQTVSGLDANWLEHMSDHFRKGGVLVNAVFYLGIIDDSLHSLTDGVFIFEAVSTEDSKTMQGYDAIVVEQWTVLEGVEVQTDYVPLLNSLAAYGWQLTCVLPTPVIKTTREGNVSTKQIVFLQRPCLPQKIKKKESKFQWRFSREEMHNRQMRKSKGKLGARDKRQAEENEKNLEDQFSKAGDVGNCVASRQQEDRTSEEMRVPSGEVTEEKLCPPGQLWAEGGTVHNGPACSGHLVSDPGEGTWEGAPEVGPVESTAAEDN
ncbi:raftlin [Talpa occidentalis]|uniref:raftlin n=1 Tax=Talpa occidentalis TaxID=50954 RepID=UPI00188F87F0|nr:raftlin [Talpa occidentalis]XP_037380658.1 raftlin [Talpa occidentalis]XP_037380661.1 raftlin [Talpa occidentalis]XP_037380668.1 raftlin [Talpa occidentalis]XP_037380676.1 raftlin [Talpa occidentalis]